MYFILSLKSEGFKKTWMDYCQDLHNNPDKLLDQRHLYQFIILSILFLKNPQVNLIYSLEHVNDILFVCVRLYSLEYFHTTIIHKTIYLDT